MIARRVAARRRVSLEHQHVARTEQLGRRRLARDERRRPPRTHRAATPSAHPGRDGRERSGERELVEHRARRDALGAEQHRCALATVRRRSAASASSASWLERRRGEPEERRDHRPREPRVALLEERARSPRVASSVLRLRDLGVRLVGDRLFERRLRATRSSSSTSPRSATVGPAARRSASDVDGVRRARRGRRRARRGRAAAPRRASTNSPSRASSLALESPTSRGQQPRQPEVDRQPPTHEDRAEARPRRGDDEVAAERERHPRARPRARRPRRSWAWRTGAARARATVDARPAPSTPRWPARRRRLGPTGPCRSRRPPAPASTSARSASVASTSSKSAASVVEQPIGRGRSCARGG